MKLYCGIFYNYTFKIYESNIIKEDNYKIYIDKEFSVPGYFRESEIEKDHIEIKYPIESCTGIKYSLIGFYYISKDLSKVEDELDNYRKSKIAELKEELDKYESHLITFVGDF